MANCPVCGMVVDTKTALSLEYKVKTYYFMNDTHLAAFAKKPENFLARKPKHED